MSEGWALGDGDSRHPYAFGDNSPAKSHFDGLQFLATFQLRTPKYVLERHGQIIPPTAAPPSDFEPWMGIWIPKSRTNVLDEVYPGIAGKFAAVLEVATFAGSAKPGHILPFLIAMREIIEDDLSPIEDRRTRILDACENPDWQRYVDAAGGAAQICADYLGDQK